MCLQIRMYDVQTQLIYDTLLRLPTQHYFLRRTTKIVNLEDVVVKPNNDKRLNRSHYFKGLENFQISKKSIFLYITMDISQPDI